MALAACASTPGEVTEKSQGDGKASAAPLLQDPVAKREKSRDAFLAVGIESLRKNDPERARKNITRALEIDSKSPEALNAMALLYRYEGDAKREEEYYRKALRADSGFSKARNNYASLLYSQHRYDDAIEQLERAIADERYEQRAMAFLNLGRCYLAVKKYEKAESALQRSLRLNSDMPDALVELADVYLARGIPDSARFYLKEYGARARHTARSLWIGIRVESGAGGNADALSSYELQLQRMYPDSRELAEWQAWKKGEPQAVKPKTRRARPTETN